VWLSFCFYTGSVPAINKKKRKTVSPSTIILNYFSRQYLALTLTTQNQRFKGSERQSANNQETTREYITHHKKTKTQSRNRQSRGSQPAVNKKAVNKCAVGWGRSEIVGRLCIYI